MFNDAICEFICVTEENEFIFDDVTNIAQYWTPDWFVLCKMQI